MGGRETAPINTMIAVQFSVEKSYFANKSMNQNTKAL